MHGNRFAPAVRTGADRMRDVDLFLSGARDSAIMAQTAEGLASFYGVRDVRAVGARSPLPDAPCFRCEARGWCEHRQPAGAL